MQEQVLLSPTLQHCCAPAVASSWRVQLPAKHQAGYIACCPHHCAVRKSAPGLLVHYWQREPIGNVSLCRGLR